MKNLLIPAALIALLQAPFCSANAFSDAKEAVEYRQASFQLIRHNMLDIRDIVQAGELDNNGRLQQRANALALLTQLPWEAFSVPGADKEKGNSKAAVWQNLQDFNERGQKLAASAASLQQAVTSNNAADIRRAFGNFARNCKACHDNYKD